MLEQLEKRDRENVLKIHEKAMKAKKRAESTISYQVYLEMKQNELDKKRELAREKLKEEHRKR